LNYSCPREAVARPGGSRSVKSRVPYAFAIRRGKGIYECATHHKFVAYKHYLFSGSFMKHALLMALLVLAAATLKAQSPIGYGV
jgi:hypothetical protein